MLLKGTMSKGSQGNEEDPIVPSLRSKINGLNPNLISKDPKIESDVSSALDTVENGLAKLIEIIHDSREKCKSSTSQSSHNKNATDSQGESDELITLLTENIKERLSTRFQQPYDKGKNVLAEKIEENESRRQEHRQTIPDLPMGSLRMRYNVLGPLLKRCLLFLSVFLENEIIKKRSLIYWWIGEGWVMPSEIQTAEQVGEDYFKMLLLSGLIQPVCKKHDKHPRGCEIKPSVKDMLISIAADDYFFAFDSQKNPTDKCKRACLVANKKEQVVEVSLDPKPHNLISLFNVNAHYLAFAKNKFSSLESIVVLQLGRWQSLKLIVDHPPVDHPPADHPRADHLTAYHHIETEDTKFLDNLGVMKNLRYLSLQGISKITALPDSCGQLTSLQILDLRGCHHLERLPNGITQLKNLTHLDISECPFLEGMPKGLSGLSELQVLKGFVLNNSGVDVSCELSELSNLKKLRKLSIKALARIRMNELEQISSLRSLTISWARKKEVLSSLAFPPDLKKLDLQCIPPSESEPLDWLRPEKLKNLKKLYIRGGYVKSLNLGTGTDKWNVETLRLRFLNELEWRKWSELAKAFPSLAFIEIFKCPKLEANPASVGPLVYDKDKVLIMKRQA